MSYALQSDTTINKTLKILILTAGYGEGHNAAAYALANAYKEKAPDACKVVDLFSIVSPKINQVTRKLYIQTINKFPYLWSTIYGWMDHSSIIPKAISSLRTERNTLLNIINDEKPDVICSTYPVYSFLIEKLRKDNKLSVPHYSIVTDSISINSLWWKAGAHGWFVPNEDSREFMISKGVDGSKIHTTGFPVNPYFANNSKSVIRPSLDNNQSPRVLYIINSGTRFAEETASALLEQTDWEITCAVGRDEKLKNKLIAKATGRSKPATILGWTNEIPKLLMTHHVVVSKAGGATTQEAIAACCPMIVNQIVPGQEEGNYELLRRRNIGSLSQTPDEVIKSLKNAFSNSGALWNQWHHAISDLSQPKAAYTIIDHLIKK
jgi:processive 1,2-diacylglycerol beta-glucosyltransferase